MSTYAYQGHARELQRERFSELVLHKATEVAFAAVRDDSAPRTLDIEDDDVVAVRLEDGFRLWLRGDALRREFGAETRDDLLRLEPGLGMDAAQRGVGGWLLQGLDVFGIDPAERLVAKTAERVEGANDDRLRRLDPNAPQPWSEAAWPTLEGPLPEAEDQPPLLLFVHGTFSSTLGSFGELFKAPGPAATLSAHYAGRIYGFDHRTLSESPIANALALAKQLPRGARLHLVSHSRGGLVGDLLCMAPLLERQDLASPAYLQHLSPADQRDLPLLVEELRAKRPCVERFVRVASPSRGTTLASGRIDRWLSVVSHLVSMVPMLGAVVADALLEFVLAVVKAPKDAETLPGLAAMMPDSPLVGLLNRPDLEIPEPSLLAVIAGDVQATGRWGRLRLLLPDLFFAGDHDLVVNTGSMYGGLRRARGWYCFDQGADVNHFNYFGITQGTGGAAASQPITVDALLLGLLGEPPGRFYRPLAEAPVSAPARGADGGSARRPVLFVLPGFMGSSLAVRDLAGAVTDEVWLSIRRIAAGEWTRLRMDQPLPIQATGLLGLAYGELIGFLSRSHAVQPFAYDWRRSVREAAALLAEEIARALDRAEADNQPVHILAHCMGGLVARALIADRPDLWQRLRARGGRLVMLGTPNQGSWEAVRLLVARAATLQQLALIDPTNDAVALLAVLSDFPGLLELLPEDPRDFFSEPIWRRLQAQDAGGHWQLPGQGRPGAGAPDRLRQARATRHWLRERAIDPQGMVYVAGQAPTTPSDLQPLVEPEPVRFVASGRGDGMVLWDAGLLPGVPTWYAPGVGHGDLTRERALFGAIEDLLTQGRTDAGVVQREAPVARGEDRPRALAEPRPAYLPDADLLARTALAIGPPRAHAPTRHGMRVAVTHGSLAFVSRRVAIGHYEGDTIIDAEAYLDQVLGGRLRARQDLGLYPGPAGSHALFDHPSPHGKPPGALVIGLGEVGALTPSLLSASFARGLLELARRVVEGIGPEAEAAEPGPRLIALSCLLIGTGAGGIAVEESVLALLRGAVEANRTLAQAFRDDEVRIDAIEFIEVWEDRAVAAARALRRIDRDPELSGLFDVEGLVRAGTGGNRGLCAAGASRDWWHRLQVRGNEQGALRFTLLTQRARAEETLVPTRAALVERFVERAAAGTAYDPDQNRTLFEMLLPNRLKDGGVLRSNLVLVLDRDSARFPWEMLEDRWSQPLPGQRASTRAERVDGRKPGAVEFGMVRQLATRSYRGQPIMSLGRSALVVGDPRSDFPPLPGARDEAKRVAAQLEQSDYRVTTLVQSNAQRIMVALHADAYQILHLAGHGVHRSPLPSPVFKPGDAGARPLPDLNATANPAATPNPSPDPNPELVSGLVIGEGVVLTPGDVQQMRRVPELVFLNCCHLGRVDAPGDARTPDRERSRLHRLAANLAVQFIEMGVRAVVAAGWTVNDQAALTFAEVFYRELADGRRFGEAVRLARERTWQDHRPYNTWGAYQCYGDPDFSLGGGRRQRAAPEPIVYVYPVEAVTDLDNLRAAALTASPADMPGLHERLERIERALAAIVDSGGPDWCEQGDVAEALGLARGELGRFAEAAAMLDRAIRADDARVSWNAIEQRARFQARHAKELCRRDDDGSQRQGRELFRKALDALDSLQRIPPHTLTVERYRSLSGIYRRRVQTLPPGERAAELERLVAVFDEAAKVLNPGDTDPLDPYSRLLWLSGKLMLTAYSARRLDEICPAFIDWCTEIEQRAPQYEIASPGAAADAIRLEVCLLLRLQQGALTDSAADALIADLDVILTRGVSARQLSSMLDHAELLQVLAAGATHKQKSYRPQSPALARIVEALRDRQRGI